MKGVLNLDDGYNGYTRDAATGAIRFSWSWPAGLPGCTFYVDVMPDGEEIADVELADELPGFLHTPVREKWMLIASDCLDRAIRPTTLGTATGWYTGLREGD